MTKTKIEWTDEVWNPTTGCSKVSQGCKNCYAERDWKRLSVNSKTAYYGREFTDVQCHSERLEQPLKWKNPRLIFVNSMSDLFHETVPDEFLDQVFAVMALCPRHQFQLLTKRAERMQSYVSGLGCKSGYDRLEKAARSFGWSLRFCDIPLVPWPIPSVWLGVSCEDQATADERIPWLLKTPAAVRFISYEPALSPINLMSIGSESWDVIHGWKPHVGQEGANTPFLNWIIAGGESGPNARPSHPEWFRSIRDQCQAADVPFFFKQWGEWIGGRFDRRKAKFVCQASTAYFKDDGNFGQIFWTNPGSPKVHIWDEADHYWTHASARVGKKKAGSLLDGKEWKEYPQKQTASPGYTGKASEKE